MRGFLAILNEGTVTAAAKSISVSQPTLSRQMDELEQALGVVLFERGRKGAVPTEAALAIAESARELQSASNALALAATGKSQMLNGVVRISASQVVSTFILPHLITDLLQEAPNLEIELASTNVLTDLTSREADIAIRMVAPSQPDLIARKVNEMQMGAWAHRRYVEAYGIPNDANELFDHVMIGYDSTPQIIEGFRKAGFDVSRRDFRFRCDDQVAVIAAMNEGTGIGFAPRIIAAKNPHLVEVFTEFEIPNLTLWLVTHREVKTNRRIRMVYDHLSSNLAAMKL